VLKSLVPNAVEVPVYDIVIEPDKLESAVAAIVAASAVVLTSATVAEVVASRVDLRGKRVVAIGPVTSAKLAELGIPHIVAPEATIEAAVKAATVA